MSGAFCLQFQIGKLASIPQTKSSSLATAKLDISMHWGAAS